MSLLTDALTRRQPLRILDLVYFLYFATHIPVTVLIDFQLFCPSHWVPQILKDALAFYVTTYKDPFMGSTTPVYWYSSFVVCELLFQLPFFFIACIGLVKAYGAHVATTVLPSVVEILCSPTFKLTQIERYILCAFYVPYFCLPVIMVIDSYYRINSYLRMNTEKKLQ
ncbi:transmembrane protein 6/97 [Mycotypha africana]|uniref:transmembrane protein 6/97 n=1 Tax=Mycotypha africana TaxID=64632 RepID=UPI0023018BC9|nr:transmembrane protein 6/97 [Mycotypha africana]KAI8984342.1 transmembrane protein 6/97 [Mycotypha africana]